MPDKPPSASAPSRVQMADIARLSGVAISTVSRALAGSELVTEKTRLRIVELAQSLNYAVNAGAQNLRLKQNNTVAVVVPYGSKGGQDFSDPFFLSLLGGIAEACNKLGYEMLLSSINPERVDAIAQPYWTGRAMGIVSLGQNHHHAQLNTLAMRGVPLVVFGAKLPQDLYCTVGSDNIAGGAMATGHLLAQGARNIVFIGDPDTPEPGQRYEGYLQAHRQRGLEPHPALCRKLPFVRAQIEADMAALLRDGPAFDGIFAGSDVSAMAAIHVLLRHGKRVPEDVAVVGYDDIVLAQHAQPALTTVRQCVDVAGTALLDALLRQVNGERTPSVLLPTTLVQRASTRSPL